jgi:hypothetical protein
MKTIPLTRHGQVKVGDVLLIKRNSEFIAPVEVKQICFEGTPKEEFVLSKNKNVYFILSRFLLGTSWIKECSILENGRLYSISNSMRDISGNDR